MPPKKRHEAIDPAMEKLSKYVLAGYPVILVHTLEEHRTVRAIASWVDAFNKEGHGQRKSLYKWDLAKGWYDYQTKGGRDIPDPSTVIPHFADAVASDSILLLPDFHAFLHDRAPSNIRNIKENTEEFKSKQKTLVIISPVIKIPVELEKLITIVEFELPSEEDMFQHILPMIEKNIPDLARSITSENFKAARGLTLEEAENAVALSLGCNGLIEKEILEREKLQAIKKTHGLELYRKVGKSELGGLENLKEYIANRKKAFYEKGLPKLNGILLVGLPGAGKSLSAKVIASELDFPLIRLDIGSLKGSLVGESEGRMRQALKLIDAISPCVVWVDEIEKAIGGVQSSNKTDGGTTSNMFGYLLTWMQESESRKYIVGTCNDIGDLMQISQGALVRRFDDVFFVDCPTNSERKEIIKIMNRRYGTSIPVGMSDIMQHWTGAEIEKMAIASVYDGMENAIKAVKPIYYANSKALDNLRNWARENARIANILDSRNGDDSVRKITQELVK